MASICAFMSAATPRTGAGPTRNVSRPRCATIWWPSDPCERANMTVSQVSEIKALLPVCESAS